MRYPFFHSNVVTCNRWRFQRPSFSTRPVVLLSSLLFYEADEFVALQGEHARWLRPITGIESLLRKESVIVLMSQSHFIAICPSCGFPIKCRAAFSLWIITRRLNHSCLPYVSFAATSRLPRYFARVCDPSAIVMPAWCLLEGSRQVVLQELIGSQATEPSLPRVNGEAPCSQERGCYLLRGWCRWVILR